MYAGDGEYYSVSKDVKQIGLFIPYLLNDLVEA
jgi:hypothetical protein